MSLSEIVREESRFIHLAILAAAGRTEVSLLDLNQQFLRTKFQPKIEHRKAEEWELEKVLIKETKLKEKAEEPKPQKTSKDNSEGLDDLKLSEPEHKPEVTYSFNGEMLQQTYGAFSLDIEKMWYGSSNKFPPQFHSEDEYWTSVRKKEESSEMLSPVEAEKLFTKIQYEAAEHSIGQVSFEDKRKFDFWIKFNSAQFKMFETLFAFTPEVNYAPPR